MDLVEFSFDTRRDWTESLGTSRTEYAENTELYPSTGPLWLGVSTLWGGRERSPASAAAML